ncbi:MAG: mechanosensitive ion channel family protein [Methanomicrobiales archaeon]
MEIDPLLRDIIVISITIIVAFIIIKWGYYVLKRFAKYWDVEPTLIQLLQEIIKYSVYIAALTIILKEVGWDITAIAVSLGIAGVAIGFAARDLIANFISGFIILADKSFKVGDVIEISGEKGKVTKLGFRRTTIITPDNKIIIIPNSSFSKNPYTNHTFLDLKRVDLDIVIPYELDLDDVTKSLEEIAMAFEWSINDPKPTLMIKNLSDVGLNATLTTWAEDPWKVDKYRTILAKEVKKILVSKDA